MARNPKLMPTYGNALNIRRDVQRLARVWRRGTPKNQYRSMAITHRMAVDPLDMPNHGQTA